MSIEQVATSCAAVTGVVTQGYQCHTLVQVGFGSVASRRVRLAEMASGGIEMQRSPDAGDLQDDQRIAQ